MPVSNARPVAWRRVSRLLPAGALLATFWLNAVAFVAAAPGQYDSPGGPGTGTGGVVGVRLVETRTRVVRMAGDNNFPPFEFVSASGEYKGFNVDIMRAIALELGLDLELVPMPWASARDALELGFVDAIQGMKYSRERDQVLDFSVPYFRSAQGIFVKSDNLSVSGLESLAGLKVAVQEGDYGHEIVKKIHGVETVVFENQESAMDALLSGAVDAFVGNRFAGQYVAQRRRRTAELKIAGNPIDPADYCVAVKEGNRELASLLNAGLDTIKKKGTYEKIYAKWFGEEIQPPAAGLKRTLAILQGVLAVALVIGLAVVRWNRTLRKEVAVRTAALARSDALKDRILNSSFAGIAAISEDGRVLATNNRALELMGVERAEIQGKPWTDTYLRHMFDGDLIADVLSLGSTYRNLETRLKRNGSEVVLGYNAGPLYAAGGNHGGALVSFDDITENKQLQATLARRDKMEALGELVSGIAHEIRNPLTAIKAFLEMLPAKYDNESYRAEVTRHVPAEIDRLNRIISDLLEYSRPRRPVEEDVEVRQIIDDILVLFKSRTDGAGVLVSVDVQPTLRVRADKGQLKQIMINLMLNAVEATEGGGRVAVSGAAVDNRGVIAVEDNGPGISEKDLGRVFDPFFTTKEKGSGLGLWIAYELTKENGGDIELRSAEGAGTTVTVRLRLA
ncbi:MAG: transporter substrate-binding domain-containing protein [Firmicutes bacterium]|nr:transporter substrate-binding domain-containing protein [Bacillota bacterium]